MKEAACLQLLHSRNGAHPFIEELLEVISDENNLYKITPWYSGGELFDAAPLLEEAAKPLFVQILEALSFVHGQGET